MIRKREQLHFELSEYNCPLWNHLERQLSSKIDDPIFFHLINELENGYSEVRDTLWDMLGDMVIISENIRK